MIEIWKSREENQRYNKFSEIRNLKTAI